MKKALATTLSLAMLLGAMTVNAGATYSNSDNNVTYASGTTANTGYGGGVEKGQLAGGDTIGTGSVNIHITTGKESTTTNVYAVSIDKTELSFSYGKDTSYIWNPEKQQYVIVKGSGSPDQWTTSADTITITNYSDLPIDVEASFQKDGGIRDEITVAFTDSDADIKDDGKLKIVSAVTTNNLSASGTPQKGTFTVALSGAPTVPYNNTKLGTITLTIKVPTV